MKMAEGKVIVFSVCNYFFKTPCIKCLLLLFESLKNFFQMKCKVTDYMMVWVEYELNVANQ